MNFIFVSPNFPVRYYKWVEALRGHGVNVLGIGDTPWHELHHRLKSSITEYYYLPNLNDYPSVLGAARYFNDKYGKIDFIESDNEWWLELDAQLREDLGVNTGFHPSDMRHIKAKSAMKASFQAAGAKTMRYILVNGPEDLEAALAFAKKVGYPLFVKPDIGVGACSSYSLKNEESLRNFLKEKLITTYIMEEFVDGKIISFDGICDGEGEAAFCTVDIFSEPVADIVNEHIDYYYYTNPFDLPFEFIDGKKFLSLGKQVVKAFGIKNRAFHIEFFVLKQDKKGLGKKGDFVALECNMRPPGGQTPDLIDFANSVSVYEIYADLVCYGQNRQKMDYEKYYAFAAARRDCVPYEHSHDEILNRYYGKLCMSGRYPEHMAIVMGDSFYYARFKTIEEGKEFVAFVCKKAG